MNWLRLRPACSHCGLAFERREPDHFLGSMSVNMLLTQGMFVVVFVAQVLATRPDIPWDRVLWTSLAAMVVTPFAIYPWAKLLWLAGDLAFRPRGEGGERH